MAATVILLLSTASSLKIKHPLRFDEYSIQVNLLLCSTPSLYRTASHLRAASFLCTVGSGLCIASSSSLLSTVSSILLSAASSLLLTAILLTCKLDALLTVPTNMNSPRTAAVSSLLMLQFRFG